MADTFDSRRQLLALFTVLAGTVLSA